MALFCCSIRYTKPSLTVVSASNAPQPASTRNLCERSPAQNGVPTRDESRGIGRDFGTNNQSAGSFYKGFISATVPSNVPAAYQDKMRQVTVTVFWTNYPQKPHTNLIVRSRQMQTYVARYGMQNYMFQ